MIARENERLQRTWLAPELLPAADAVRVIGQPLARAASLMELLRRPGVSYDALMSLPGAGEAVTDAEVAQQLEIQAKYAGYIERQSEEIELHRRHEETALPPDFDYHHVHGLSIEARQKLVVTPARHPRPGRAPLGHDPGCCITAADSSAPPRLIRSGARSKGDPFSTGYNGGDVAQGQARAQEARQCRSPRTA